VVKFRFALALSKNRAQGGTMAVIAKSIYEVKPRRMTDFMAKLAKAAYGARTNFEHSNPEWKKLFAASPDAPESPGSVELLTEIDPIQMLCP
jgi:hypothetical protein